ncbi:hypothetical protein [Nocardia terpenica]|uniref:Uncharacterized protein n=1 Tax=Nocardia terpenica TaxID=455432 RepID=A0A291RCR5_9NOCA|nr:hypothetical protein [Nocardia terpenica]ATL65099.1 hypothetical protein CRH09_01505 [Nocardia terpenica]
MGAQQFITYSEHTDIRAAFDAAVEDAQHEYGHGGYTGSIAEKDAYTIITADPIGETAADTLIDDLFDAQDPRIDDKHGPAGAIAIADTDNPARIAGWVFFGWAAS